MKKLFAIAILLILVFAASVSTVLAETPITQSFDTIGSIVTFGRYEQDGNEENGPEEIEWIVLDVQDGKVLLLSRYGLEVKPYNTEHTKHTEVTWETCTLRAWLNSDFLNKAFSAEEQSAILTTEVDNSGAQGYSKWSTSGGNNTQDKIFLLSYAEANRYLGVTFEDRNNTLSRVAPTDYAIKTGAWTSDSYQTADGKPAGWWWLRSPGSDLVPGSAAGVDYDGSIYSDVVCHVDSTVVRPAFWLDLNAADEKDGDTTVKIHGVVYYNTKKVIPVEPDESAIVNEELPINGSMTDKKTTAYAFINDEQSGDILVCLIDGEWYQFLATERAGQP